MQPLNLLLLELIGGDDQRAEAAALALGEHGEQALSIIGPLLHSASPDLRWWAVRALAELPSGVAAPRLAQSLADTDLEVRRCAALGLSRCLDSQAVPALADALRSPDSLLARLAGNALSAARGSAAAPVAAEVLLRLLDDPSQRVRLEAVRALALLGETSTIPRLFAALDEDSALLEYWANEGLERMGVGMAFFSPQ